MIVIAPSGTDGSDADSYCVMSDEERIPREPRCCRDTAIGFRKRSSDSSNLVFATFSLGGAS